MGDSSESNLNVNLCQLDLYLEVFYEIKKDRKKSAVYYVQVLKYILLQAS